MKYSRLGYVALATILAFGGTVTVMKAQDGQRPMVTQQVKGQWLASRFKGTDVFGPDNEKIGDVTDILFDRNGKIVAYVVGVGGFLGIGAKAIAINPSAFTVLISDGTKGSRDGLGVYLTKGELRAAPTFEACKMQKSGSPHDC